MSNQVNVEIICPQQIPKLENFYKILPIKPLYIYVYTKLY